MLIFVVSKEINLMKTQQKTKVMKKSNLPIEVVIENQTKLVETLSANALKAMDIFKMEDNWSKKSKEIVAEYVKEQKELVGKVMQPTTFENGFEGMSEQMTKAMEMNFAYANRAMDFYREAMFGMIEGKQETPMTRVMELMNDNMHAVIDATKKNMDAARTISAN